MKRFLSVWWVLLALPISALPISQEGRQEARLFNTFLKAVAVYPTDTQQSVQLLQKALAMEPESNYLRRMLVSAALATDNLALADQYSDFIKSDDNDAEDWAVYAVYQMRKGNTQQALEAYQSALAKNPDSMELLYQYLLLLSVSDFDKTVKELEKFAQNQPLQASKAYTQIGHLYQRRRQWEQALSYLNKAIAADEQDPAPRLLKAEIYEQTSQYFLMLHEFEELEKTGYTSAGMFSRMAAVFLLVKDFPQAKNYFLKAKQLDEHDPASNYFLSLLAEQNGELDQAIFYLQQASDYSTQASRWLQVSFLEKKLNRPQESLRTLAEAYRRFEDNVEIGFFYGLALNDAKQYKKAARVFSRLVSLRPDYIQARLHYAYALESLHRYKEMEEQIKQILEEQPQHAPALNLLAYSLAQRDVRLDEALTYSNRALALMPDDISLQDTLGWIYIRQGNLERAQEVFSAIPAKAVEQNPEIAYHIGFLYWQQGRNEEALSYLETAKDAWPAAKKLYKKLSRQKKSS